VNLLLLLQWKKISVVVSSTVVSVTASLELVSNPPGVESTVEGSANQDGSQGNVQGQDKCDDKIIALWWQTAEMC